MIFVCHLFIVSTSRKICRVNHERAEEVIILSAEESFRVPTAYSSVSNSAASSGQAGDGAMENRSEIQTPGVSFQLLAPLHPHHQHLDPGHHSPARFLQHSPTVHLYSYSISLPNHTITAELIFYRINWITSLSCLNPFIASHFIYNKTSNPKHGLRALHHLAPVYHSIIITIYFLLAHSSSRHTCLRSLRPKDLCTYVFLCLD